MGDLFCLPHTLVFHISFPFMWESQYPFESVIVESFLHYLAGTYFSYNLYIYLLFISSDKQLNR
jgi:hypothetical protein